MEERPKVIVQQAYDHIAEWYLGWVQDQRDSPRERYANKVLQNKTAGSPQILELGCGPGVPITRMLLARGARVVANDISAKQITMAKARCPQANFIAGDMADLSFEPASFDGVVSFYTIFHLPRAEQKVLLMKVQSWLRPGGMVALNFATVDEEEIHGELMGHGMFWSSYGVEDSIALVEDAGLEVVEAEILEAGDGRLGEDDPDYGAKFLWVAARKGAGLPVDKRTTNLQFNVSTQV